MVEELGFYKEQTTRIKKELSDLIEHDTDGCAMCMKDIFCGECDINDFKKGLKSIRDAIVL